MDGRDRKYLEASYRGPGQRIGDDRNAVPGSGQDRVAPQRIMLASAKPRAKSKKRNNYLLAHLPALGSAKTAPSPVELTAPAPSGSWAPVDLVGDGSDLPSNGKLPPLVELAPIQLNYAQSRTGLLPVMPRLRGSSQSRRICLVLALLKARLMDCPKW